MKKKQTRRDLFLAEMAAVVPWARLLALIVPNYPKVGAKGATSRRADRRDMLLANDADEVFIDNGRVAPAVRAAHPGGINRVLGLVGTTTLLDSLQLAAPGGSVCMTGMVGNSWEFERFSPMGAIPTAVNLTTYSGGSDDFISTPLQTVIDAVQTGAFAPPISRVFAMDEIVAAHRAMEDNTAGGKIVVVT